MYTKRLAEGRCLPNKSHDCYKIPVCLFTRHLTKIALTMCQAQSSALFKY